MSRIIHFEIEAGDVSRASRFYTDVFGWKFQKWDGPMEYWLITTGTEGEPGIDGGLSKRGAEPTGTVNTVGVKSVDDSIAQVLKAGGKVTRPKRAVPGVGWMAYCKDTEGNLFGIMQEDPTAK